jgi:hypothetical protein
MERVRKSKKVKIQRILDNLRLRLKKKRMRRRKRLMT